MGADAARESEAAAAVFRAADQALGEPLSRLCFEGPADQLQLTVNTQPAILTTSIALLRGLGAACDMVAGHSLGEYSANVAAGTLAFDDAVRLVRLRGQFMQEAVPVGEGAMAAVLSADTTVVERICAETPGVVEAVNYNCPGQLVIAGSAAAVAQASEALRAAGAKLKALPVSAPFHCRLMRPAEEQLAPRLVQAAFRDGEVPLYANVDAQPLREGSAAREALSRQVSRPVRWQQIIERMVADGARLFVEIGPGRALTGMITRIAKDVAKVNVQASSDFEAARQAIARCRAESA
jgi:[acyl-carrier-protein] S-malonyltransferase